MIEPQTRNGVSVNYVFLIAYLVCLSAFGSFVNDMYVPSLPSMTKFFGCSASMVQLGLTMGMIGLAVGQIILGPVSDKYGRKPVLVISLVIFMIPAVVCIFSPTIHFFLICRFLQGIGASGGYFLARSIPADLYAGRALAKTMAIIGGINGIAPASAPVIGGVLSQHWGWKSVFIALVVMAVIILILSRRLKESLPKAERRTGSMWSVFKTYGMLVRNRRFMIHVLLKGSALGVLFAYISAAPFIMQTHFGFRQDVFGCIIGVNALFAAAGSMAALKFKLLKQAAFVGGVALFVSILAVASSLLFFDSFWMFELLLLPMVFCLGMIFTSANTLAMNEGRDNAGEASAVLGVGGYVFGAIVAPLVGLGNIMHSTAYVFVALGMITLLFSFMARKLPADLNS